jgi:mono/diheme cytochrome c family protein
MVKHLLLLPAVILLACLPASAGSPAPQKKTAAEPATEKAPAVSSRVKQIYQIDCAICHGDNGNGKTDLGSSLGVTSDFSNPKSLDGKVDQAVFDAIRKGKDKMPPEDGGRATDDQVRGLVQYLRNLSKGGPAPATQPAPAPVAEPAAPSTPPASPTVN